MDKVLNQLVDGITSGNVLVVSIIIVVAIIFNIEKIFNFLDTRKKVKLQLIEESLNNTNINGNTKLYLESLIETEYFKSITGINLEKEIREALIKAHQDSNGELKFKHFKRAIPYLIYKDAILSVKIDTLAIFGFIYNFLFGIMGVISGVFFFILPALSSDISISKIASIYSVATFLSCFGAFMLLQSLPVISARYVQKILKK